jgi:hypothetical protein
MYKIQKTEVLSPNAKVNFSTRKTLKEKAYFFFFKYYNGPESEPNTDTTKTHGFGAFGGTLTFGTFKFQFRNEKKKSI